MAQIILQCKPELAISYLMHMPNAPVICCFNPSLLGQSTHFLTDGQLISAS